MEITILTSSRTRLMWWRLQYSLPAEPGRCDGDFNTHFQQNQVDVMEWPAWHAHHNVYESHWAFVDQRERAVLVHITRTSQAIPPGWVGPIVPGQDPDFDQQHAHTLCDYYTEIGPKFAYKIPSPIKPFQHHLIRPNTHSLFVAPCVPDEINKVISSPKPKSSCGHDKISSKLAQN